MSKKDFFEAIILVKEFGLCPVCFAKGKISKSTPNAYNCTECACTSTFNKDSATISYYVIQCGRRILKSYRILASSPKWKRMLEEAQRLKKKIRRGRRF